MGKWLVISLVFHTTLLVLVIWSDEISFLMIEQKIDRQSASGVFQVDLTYKATDTPMLKGEQRRDLPPPDVKIPSKAEKEESPLKKPEKKKSKPAEKPVSSKNFKNIFDKLRREAADEKRPLPKLDNFPMSKQGEKGSLGTGGRSLRTLSPAELALQSAMRKYFELNDASSLRKKYPDLSGYIQLSLVGYGNQLSIRSLKLLESTGFPLLDRSCEDAIRKALDVELFSGDVVSELNGKESGVICSP